MSDSRPASQQIERLRRECHALVAAPQAVIGRVELERVELLHFGNVWPTRVGPTPSIAIRASANVLMIMRLIDSS